MIYIFLVVVAVVALVATITTTPNVYLNGTEPF